MKLNTFTEKNWLFCGSEVGAEALAIVHFLIDSCLLPQVDVTSYFADVLERISEHQASDVPLLFPVNWKFIKQNEDTEVLEAQLAQVA